ncbi:MAG: hypothetical protein ACYCSN_08765 [Acidobacteriaceae bacterium]
MAKVMMRRFYGRGKQGTGIRDQQEQGTGKNGEESRTVSRNEGAGFEIDGDLVLPLAESERG